MAVETRSLEIESPGRAHAADITGQARSALEETGLRDGILTLFVPGATGGLTTVEYENGLLEDLHALWERLAPSDASYRHGQAWNDDNGHSHLRATLLGPSLTVPFAAGELTLGTWQQIVFIDFDTRPRQRRLVLQFLGEA